MSLKTVLVTPFLTTILIAVKGQKIDSLNSLLKEKQGIERADVFFELGREYLSTSQYAAASKAGMEGYVIAEKFQDSLRLVKNGRVLASGLRRSGAVDSAIDLYKKLLATSRKMGDPTEYILILNGLGMAYIYTAEYDKALLYFFKLLEIDKCKGDVAEEAITLNNIGLAYYKLKDYRTAQKYFENSISLKMMANVNYDLSFAFINLGLCHVYLGDAFEAKRNVLRGLDVCPGKCSDNVMLNADFANGLISFSLKKYEDAERYFLRSYAISETLTHTRYQFDNIDYLTQIYLLQNRVDDASRYLNKAETLIRDGASYNLEIIKIYSRFFEMYSKIHAFEKAAFYQQKYIQLKDSVYNEELTTNLMRVEADHLERENKIRLAAQEKILFLNEKVISRQRLLNIVISILVIVASAFTMGLWRNYTLKKATNLELKEQVKVRTAELQLSCETLQTAFKRLPKQIEDAASDVKNTVVAMQGLCVMALNDVVDPVARQYILEVQKTSGDMLIDLEPLFQIKNRIVNDLLQ